MIIEFRMRPPARGFLNIGVYDDVARTAKLTECFSMKQAPSVARKSPELMLQEMDTAGVTMGVIPGRNGHFKGSISNDDIISLLSDFQMCIRDRPSDAIVDCMAKHAARSLGNDVGEAVQRSFSRNSAAY